MAKDTREVLHHQQRDRDLLQIELFEKHNRGFCAAETADVSQRRYPDESVWKGLNEASAIRGGGKGPQLQPDNNPFLGPQRLESWRLLET